VTTYATTTDTRDQLIDPILFARGMAVIRIFFGIILLANGLAKIESSLARIDLGPFHANLITRDGARGILNFEINERRIREGAPQGTQVPGLKSFVNGVVLANWRIIQWVVVLVEVGAGLLLVLGLATRGAALVDLGQQLFLGLVYFSSNRWMFEQPHEYVPLIVLAIVPAGRMWGLDARLVRDTPTFCRWPF
jgi:uncharacterized membrane protein YphA (DoxX/SURF4 family)